MALSPPNNNRERILLFGSAGSGKTTAIANIAEVMQMTESDKAIWHVDTDSAWYSKGDFTNVNVFEVYDYEEIKTSLTDAVKRSNPGDWLTLDLIDRLWDASQEYYWDKIQGGATLGEVFLKAAEGEISLAGAHGANWGIINKLYKDLVKPLYRWKGSVLACAPVTEIRQDQNVEPEIKSTFGKLGLRPQGQKHLPHLFLSILLMQETRNGWTMTTAKEAWKDREYQKGLKLDDGFALSYLVNVAKWTV